MVIFLTGLLIAVRPALSTPGQVPVTAETQAARQTTLRGGKPVDAVARRDTAVSQPPLARQLGQLLMGRMTGRVPSIQLLKRIRRGEVGGIIVFPDNFATVEELRRTIDTLQAEAAAGGNPPLLVATDQEGGYVARLPAGPPGQSARQMGESGTPASVARLGEETGWYLRRYGITVDLAPVLDVPGSPANFLGSRAFGRHPRVVSRIGTAFALGLQKARVAATLKHFPGLGTATANTDLGVVDIATRASGLRWRYRPFKEAIAEGVQMVMVSNASYSSLDPSGRPACLSPTIVRGILRGQLGFEGVVITDAFSTPSPARYADAPVRALGAGVDMLLYSDSERASADAFLQLRLAAREGMLARAVVRTAYERVVALKAWVKGT